MANVNEIASRVVDEIRPPIHPDETSAPKPTEEHQTDAGQLYDEQIEKNILRRLLGHPLSSDSDGSTPETRVMLTNTKPVLPQVQRNEKGIIMSYEESDNYDLDIPLTDTKFRSENFTNAINIGFEELEELKGLTEDELADKKRIADLEKKLDLEKAVTSMLQDQLNAANDNLSNTQQALDNLANAEINTILSTDPGQSAITATQGRGEPPTGSARVQQFKLYLQRAQLSKSRPGRSNIAESVRKAIATEIKLAIPLIDIEKIRESVEHFISPIDVLLQRPGVNDFIDRLITITTDIIKTIELEETKLATGGRG